MYMVLMYLLLLYQSLTNQQVKHIYCSLYNGEKHYIFLNHLSLTDRQCKASRMKRKF